MFYVVGLGNPGDEYKSTRHNTGREAVEYFENKNDISSKKLCVIHSNEFMNNSGRAVAKIIKSPTYAKASAGKKKAFENLIVVYDDIDLPLGTLKISFNKGVGGHRGLNSVVKTIKTKEFARIRIGISPSTPKGKIKKPQGEKAVIDFILGKWKPKEAEAIKKIFKKSSEAIQTLITQGRDRAMNIYNS